jgi:hypothetical protein
VVLSKLLLHSARKVPLKGNIETDPKLPRCSLVWERVFWLLLLPPLPLLLLLLLSFPVFCCCCCCAAATLLISIIGGQGMIDQHCGRVYG